MCNQNNLPDESIIFKKNKFTDFEKLLFCNSYIKQLNGDIKNLNTLIEKFKQCENKEIKRLKDKIRNNLAQYELAIRNEAKKDKKLRKLNDELKLEKEKVRLLLAKNRKLILTQK